LTDHPNYRVFDHPPPTLVTLARERGQSIQNFRPDKPRILKGSKESANEFAVTAFLGLSAGYYLRRMVFRYNSQYFLQTRA
jgi:hypothetical protein